MRLCSLGSGSRGNAFALFENGYGLLIDAGLSYSQMYNRLRRRGFDPEGVKSLWVSHRHQDHAVSIRKWVVDHGVQVFCTPETVDTAADGAKGLKWLEAHPGAWKPIEARKVYRDGPFRVLALPTDHATEGAVTFFIAAGKKKVAFLMETGRVSQEMWLAGRGAQAYIIEANHDKHMLALDTTRPERINQRTAYTHISNSQCEMLLRHLPKTAKMVLLCHLSETCNDRDLVDEIAQPFRSESLRIEIAKQDEPTEVFDV